MTFARPLFLLLLLACVPTVSMAADSDDAAKPKTSVGSLQNQVGDSAPFGASAQDLRSTSGLFFLQSRPRLSLNPSTLPPTSAILNDNVCYTMRTYKVKRQEHFADGESGSRGYSTCELATNYQVRTAIVHVQTVEEHDSQIIEPQKSVR